MHPPFSSSRALARIREHKHLSGALLPVLHALMDSFGYIDDARALAKTTELPSSVIARVVPGFCRSAVEASCMEAVRVRRLRKGEQHDVIEALLMANSKMHPLMALALFDDEKKTNEVLARLNKFGKWAGDAFMACKEGAHEAHTGDLETLIDASYKLATQVRGLP